MNVGRSDGRARGGISKPNSRLLSRRATALCALTILVTANSFGQGALSICSFNIQFLGNSKVRDNVGLAEMLQKYDLVVVQELLAPPYPGKFPNGDPFKPKPETRAFFEQMKSLGFTNVLSEEDTGPGLIIHLNSSATEWWVVFYKPSKVTVASDLPHGFLSPIRARNNDFDRVPYAFAFRTLDSKLDFVLISVHLRPGAGLLHKQRRKHELASIASWIAAHSQIEKDYIILGDMNIENPLELTSAIPASFLSLNNGCEPTNTNVNGRKPYDHVMYVPAHTKNELDLTYSFKVENLIDAMRTPWKAISQEKYPGDSPYNHNMFRKYYSDHHPVDFKLKPAPGGDDD